MQNILSPLMRFPARILLALAAATMAGCMHVEIFHPDVEGTYHFGPDRPFWSYEGQVEHVQLPEAVTPVGQQTANWCWAAASEMLLQSQGVELSQPDIVKLAYGDTRDVGGKSPLMVDALTGTFTTKDGKKIKLQAHRADGLPHNGLEMLTSIADGRPFIVDIGYYKDGKVKRGEAYAAHSLLVCGITFRREGNDIDIISLDTIDPSFKMIQALDPKYSPFQKLAAASFPAIQGTLGIYRQ